MSDNLIEKSEGIIMSMVDKIAENAGRVHSLLEAIEESCCAESITLDEVRALSQYALSYNELVFLELDKF
jgi:hypothetical protein